MCLYEPIEGKPNIEICDIHNNDCDNCPWYFDENS